MKDWRYKHGKVKSPEYSSWIHMKQRCFNANHTNYKHYGGRGITVCDRWKESFESFYEDMGPMPEGVKVSLDRIDVNGNYEPSNCRWANHSTQMRNIRRDESTVGTRQISNGKWRAYIPVNGKQVHLGYWDNQHDATIARKTGEILLWGADKNESHD